MNEREKALENIPNGYEVVNDDWTKEGDKTWNWLMTSFQPSTIPGLRVECFTCVIRPIKTETKETV